MKNKNFILYCILGGVSNFGSVLLNLGILFLVFEYTNSTKITSFIAAIETAPFIIFGLVGGVVADWFSKRSFLLNLLLFRIPCIIIFIIFIYFKIYPLMSIIFFVISMSVINCFFNPAHRALLPQTISQIHLVKANSMYDAILRSTTILATFFSGLLLYKYNIIVLFIIDLLMYIVAFICIALMKFETNKNISNLSINRLFHDLLIFYRYINKNNEMKKLFLYTFVMVFLNTWIFDVGFLGLLKSESQNANQDYTFFKGFYSSIAILINMLIPFIFKKQSIQSYLKGSLIWGSGFFIISINQSFYFILIGLIFISIGMIISSTTRSFMIQTKISPDMHSRAFSFNAVLLYIANTISYLLFGFLSDFININILFTISSLLMIFLAIFFYIFVWSNEREKFEPF